MPGILQPSGLPMQTVMSTKFIAGICLMTLLTGSIAFVVTRSFSRDNDRVQQTPSISELLQKTPCGESGKNRLKLDGSVDRTPLRTP